MARKEVRSGPGTPGVGVGLTAFSSAAAASLPAHALAVGSAINITARQIGAVLGIAILVAIVGAPESIHGVAAFQRSWAFSILAAAIATVIAFFLGRVPSQPRSASA